VATNRTIGGSSAAPRLTDTASIGSQRVALSSRGRTFIAVGIISLFTGLILGVLDLQRLGVLLRVLPIPAWLAVRQARSGLRVGHAVTPSRIVVGEQAQVRLVLGNPHSFGTGPLRITETVPGGRPLRFSVAGVRGRQRRTVAYPLPALRRGRYTVGPTTVMASDPFGLVTADTRSTDVGELIVRPSTVRLASLTLPVAWRDGAATLSHSVGVGGSDDASVRTGAAPPAPVRSWSGRRSGPGTVSRWCCWTIGRWPTRQRRPSRTRQRWNGRSRPPPVSAATWPSAAAGSRW
jgi:hypothetical protein